MIEGLKKAYSKDKLIPFLGAGLSKVFNICDWKELTKDIVNEYVSKESTKNYLLSDKIEDENDCIGALDEIIKKKILTLRILNQQIKKKIEDSINYNLDDNKHNYLDLAELRCRCYLTTNYEQLGYKYLKKVAGDEVQIPKVFANLGSNTQNFIEQGKINYFFLHGELGEEETLLTTTESYKKNYENNYYKARLNTLFSVNTILFIGFSFDDNYVRDYIKEYLDIHNNTHYILLPESSKGKEKELIDYGLLTIFYDDSNGHVEGIRKVLLEIKNSKKKNLTVENIEEPKTLEEVAENVFVEKLRIEEIRDRKIEVCMDLFIDAELHIRNMEKSNISKEIVDCFLSKVFDEYSKIYSDYEGSPTQLLNDTHEKIEKIRYNLENNKTERIIREQELAPPQRVHKGMIHYLANERKSERKRVVWGDKWRDEE